VADFQPSFKARGSKLTGFAGTCLVLSSLLGCVTEQGRPGPALWSSIERGSDADRNVRLKKPNRTSVLAGQIAERKGHQELARRHYETAYEHDSRSVEAMTGLARLELRAGQRPAAEQWLHKARAIEPNHPHVMYTTGLMHAADRRWPQAIAHLQRAVSANPEVADFRFSLAVALAKSGDLNGAFPHFQATVGEAQAHYNIGQVLFERGNVAGARRQFQRALSLQPNLAPAQQMLARLQAPRSAPAHGPRAGYSMPRNRRPVTGGDESFLTPRRTDARRRDAQRTRQVSHIRRPNDLGSQSAWNGSLSGRRSAEQLSRAPYSPRSADDASFPTTVENRQTSGSPWMRASTSANRPVQAAPADNSFRKPRMMPDGGRSHPADPQDYGASQQGNLTPQQLQQWHNQQPAR